MAIFSTNELQQFTDTFTIQKQNGSALLLSTTGTYVNRDINVLFDVQSASATSGTATATLSLPASGSSINNASLVTSNPTGHYVKVQADASGNSKITRAGWIAHDVNGLAAASTSITNYIEIPEAIGEISVSSGTGTCVVSTNTNVILTNTDTYNNGIQFTCVGNGSVNADASITTAGYAPTSLNFTNISGTSNDGTITQYIKGVTLNTPTSGESKFSITVPNDDSTITFVFHVDTNGNVTVDDQV